MDRVGMVLSVLCMVHCAVMPFVVAWLPKIGAQWLADEAGHQWIAGAAMLLGAATFIPGVRQHRRWSVPVIGVLGLTLITHAAFAYSNDCCRVLPEASELSSVTKTTDASSTDAEDLPPCCRKGGCSKEKTSGEQDSEQPTTEREVESARPALALQTPLGGLLLVVAHVMNLRGKRCSCGGCGAGKENQAAAGN